MRFTILFLFIGLLYLPSYAAKKVSLRDKMQGEWSNMGFSSLANGSMAFSMGSEQSDHYSLSSQNTKAGAEYLRFNQHYKGVPVQGYAAALKLVGGDVQRVSGFRLENIEQDIKSLQAKLSKDEAVSLAKSEHLRREKKSLDWVYRDFFSEKVIYADHEQVARLAYTVTFFADTRQEGHPRKPFIVIDAQTGKLLEYTNNLHFAGGAKATGPGGNEKVGRVEYGVDAPALEVTSLDGNRCVLENEKVVTVDLKHQRSRGGVPFSFLCGENNERSVNGAYSPLNDAHAFGTAVFDMYDEWYGKAPLKGKLELRVHYGERFENAFWDGSAMTFGDGANLFYPLVSLDVTAHEVSHGFTQFNSNLQYRNESGGINEAYSDMAGEAAEFFRDGTNDFMVGHSIFKGEGALRYMFDPKKDGKSIDHISQFKWQGICTIFPNPEKCTDVHHSSGIYNKVFYTIATTEGWDTKKAFDLFFHANSNYWTANTGFAEGAKAVIDSANDLNYPTGVIREAFSEVGIEI